MMGIVNDNVNNTVWVHSTKNLFYINTLDEKKNIWISYVKKGKLQQALDETVEGGEN